MQANDSSPSRLAYVGCYTTEQRNGRGQGIEIYRMDVASGRWTHTQSLTGIVNPSFLALDHHRRFLYSVHGDQSYATAYRIDEGTGHLQVLGQQAVGGVNPVHLAIDPSNRFMITANYSSGSLAVLPINGDGTLSPLSDLVELTGKPGPDPKEQAASHPHHDPFDPSGRFVVVPDKGFDRVFVFRFDAERGKLLPAHPPYVECHPGAGPRHVGFHPTLPYAYVINELDSTLATYHFDHATGELRLMQVVSTLPPDFTGKNTTAEIAVAASGRFVYGSNRDHNSIVIFSVDTHSGLLTLVGWEPTQGKTPRYFGIDPSGNWLYAGNQDTDTVVTFRVDPASGKLAPTGQIVESGSPSTIVFR